MAKSASPHTNLGDSLKWQVTFIELLLVNTVLNFFPKFFPFSSPNSSMELKLWDPETLNDFYQDTQQVNNGADIHSQEVWLHDFT